MNTTEIRLQKFIADCGITSRRKAEHLIIQGKVTVNGEVVMELGTKVNPATDTVAVDGSTIELDHDQRVYIVLHKPRCVMTTVSDPEGRPTVMDLLHTDVPGRVYPVGRLDYLSEGLLIMTNDGEVANMIMHPRYNVTKLYEVKVFGSVTETIIKKLKEGTYLEDGFVKPLSVRVISQLPSKTWLEFRLGEGKNREIRKLCEAVGLTVDKLKRVAIEGLTVDGIAPGKYRFYTKRQLLSSLGLKEDGTKLAGTKTYVSPKKSVNVVKKGAQQGIQADDEIFHKFRREQYFDTIKKLKENKAKAELKVRKLETEIENNGGTNRPPKKVWSKPAPTGRRARSNFK